MIRIEAIKLIVNTSDGIYGCEAEFQRNGLNILRGDNNSGKSTLLQGILYTLGMEELLGARGEKTMQSVLKDAVEINDNLKYNVLGSEAYLQISNSRGDAITVKRSIKSENRNSKLVDVIQGRYLTEPSDSYESTPMYVHDKGAAQNITHGYHAYLEKFIGWELPMISNVKGNKVKLYLQSIFPTFFIEQKIGWSDFLATIPYYGIRESGTRAVEYILGLEVMENDLKKQELSQERQRIKTSWRVVCEKFYDIARRSSGVISGLPENPEIINDLNSISLSIKQNNGTEIFTTKLSEHITELRKELSALSIENAHSVGTNIEDTEEKLSQLEGLLTELNFKYDQLRNGQILEKEKLKLLKRQLVEVKDDLQKNKIEQKLVGFGHEESLSIADSNCPTCSQKVNASLFDQSLKQQPMGVEDNIKYLEAQDKMLQTYVASQDDTILGNESLIDYYKNQIDSTRKTIRSLKRELVSDERLPSELEIEEKVKLKSKIQFFENVQNDMANLRNELFTVISEYKDLLSDEAEIPKDYFSAKDSEKIKELDNSLRRLLKAFGYGSKSISEVKISEDNYLPSVRGVFALKKESGGNSTKSKDYDIKYDSSASDFVRAIWSYTCSLYLTTKKMGGNHPNFIVMDEPEQHSMSDDSIRLLLAEMANYTDCQTIVAASFHNSDEVYNKVTNGLDFNPIRIEGKFIKKIED
ncbi:MAG: AAA family ATPase [Fluviicola sp.]